jgi:hypothetical protein
MRRPRETRGRVSFKRALSRGNSPTKRIRTKGYMQIRWYQHRIQGGKSMTSLKKRLPRVAIKERIQAPKTRVHLLSFMRVF